MTEINKELTFDFRDDFNRRPIAEKIILLLKSDIGISPMVIDGGWGSGKTEFTHKLINLFRENKDSYELIYIDAFQADNADEPLMTLIASLLNVLPETGGREKLKEKAIPAIRFGIKTVLKAGTSWVLKQELADITKDFESDIKEACDQTINATINNLLEDHQEADQSILTLKTALSNITNTTSVIFFIDELDRCRPDFAIKMLEKIKHIFDLPDIQFVLIANKDQLRSSINHIYGNSISAQKYLDKFLKYSFSLPHSHSYSYHQFQHYPVQHYFNLIENSKVLNCTQLKETKHDKFIQKLFQVSEISLREVEKFILNIEIYQTLTKKFNDIDLAHCLLTLIGIFIFCFEPKLQKEIELNTFDAKKLNALFDVKEYKHNSSTRFSDRVEMISSLIFIESNVNNLNDHKKLGISEHAFESLKSKIDQYFDDYNYGGEMGKLRVLLGTINRLKFI